MNCTQDVGIRSDQLRSYNNIIVKGHYIVRFFYLSQVQTRKWVTTYYPTLFFLPHCPTSVLYVIFIFPNPLFHPLVAPLLPQYLRLFMLMLLLQIRLSWMHKKAMPMLLQTIPFSWKMSVLLLAKPIPLLLQPAPFSCHMSIFLLILAALRFYNNLSCQMLMHTASPQ